MKSQIPSGLPVAADVALQAGLQPRRAWMLWVCVSMPAVSPSYQVLQCAAGRLTACMAAQVQMLRHHNVSGGSWRWRCTMSCPWCALLLRVWGVGCYPGLSLQELDASLIRKACLNASSTLRMLSHELKLCIHT